MKVFLCGCLAILTPFNVSSQNPFGGIPVKGTLYDIQAFTAGDSVLVMYREATSSTSNKYVYWLDPHGEVTPVDFKIIDRAIAGITRYGTDHYYYFFDKRKKDPTLNIAHQKSKDSDIQLLPDEIAFDGRVVGAYVDEDMFVLSVERKERTLKLTRIHAAGKMEETIIKLPFDLSQFKLSEMEFIPEGKFLHANGGMAKVKLFKNGDVITILLDEPNEAIGDARDTFVAKTSVYQYNMITGKSDIYVVTETSRDIFRTFYFEDYLYRTINHHQKFELKVFDLKGKQVSHVQFLRNEAANKVGIFFREGRAGRVAKKETLYHMMKVVHQTKASLLVERDFSGQIVVTWGSYFDNKGVIAPNPSPTGLIVSAIATAILQAGEGPGISRYFYVKGDPLTGFTLADEDVNNMRTRIDAYELAEQTEKKIKIKFKGYSTLQDGVVAVYHNHTSKKLQVVRFENMSLP